jgi:hypothetical protein
MEKYNWCNFIVEQVSIETRASSHKNVTREKLVALVFARLCQKLANQE